MIINAKLNRKEPNVETEACEVMEVIELSKDEFRYFKNHLLEDTDFIAVRSDEMYSHDGIRNCILVIGEECNDGVLVCSEGYGYARYSVSIPNARQIIEAESLSPTLKKYCDMMTEKVDKIVRDALANAGEDGNYSIPIKSLETELDVPQINLHTLINMLEERDEIDVADFDENCVFMAPNRDYLEKQESAEQYQNYFDESYNDEVEIICARHVLWIYDDDGERADFTDTGMTNLDLMNKNLNGAVLANVVMKNCSLKGAELCSAYAEDAFFENVDFSEVTAEESQFKNCIFENCKFNKAMFTHSDLSQSTFHDCTFFRTSMQSCFIKGTGFTVGDGDIPMPLPDLSGSTQELDEWNCSEAEGIIQS